MHEIVWTRILALVLGPTTYAFAATLAAVIAGVAFGSWLGTWLVGRTDRPATWLALVLAAAAVTATITSALAGDEVPRSWPGRWRRSPACADGLARRSRHALTAALILPTALCLGAAFPLALALAGATAADSRRRALRAGLRDEHRRRGLRHAGRRLRPHPALRAAGDAARSPAAVWSRPRLIVVVGAASVARRAIAGDGGGSGRRRCWSSSSPPWDRELLASGAYLYAPFVPQDLDLETQLKAGTVALLRGRRGGHGVGEALTGTTTLAVDGKTDASNRSDMLTQKLVAHLPLLLHDHPRRSRHRRPGQRRDRRRGTHATRLTRADVLEISPEVVEASRFFEVENHNALDDPRTHAHRRRRPLAPDAARRQYDVIISEPSNPWIAGVAALFTREFFDRARRPGWRRAASSASGPTPTTSATATCSSIVATFTSVVPQRHGLAGRRERRALRRPAPGAGDAASSCRRGSATWRSTGPGRGRPRTCAEVGATEPFSVLSLFVAGPAELARYADGAPMLTDDRMTLEFTAPLEIHRRSGGQNGAALRALLTPGQRPPALAGAERSAGAAAWRQRALMFAQSDVHTRAYDDFQRALTLDPDDRAALDGMVRSAVLLTRSADAATWLTSLGSDHPPSTARTVATSQLLAASGHRADALAVAREAAAATPPPLAALTQIASLLADAGDVTGLDAAVAALRHAAPDAAATGYYQAVAAILRDDVHGALAHAQRAIATDPSYAPVYDLAGAAYTKLGDPDRARAMFERSLSFDAHDSTAYTNLGLLALAAGHRTEARHRFAEALWLDPGSTTARAGLARVP